MPTSSTRRPVDENPRTGEPAVSAYREGGRTSRHSFGAERATQVKSHIVGQVAVGHAADVVGPKDLGVQAHGSLLCAK
jgi:hypothetical protein